MNKSALALAGFGFAAGIVLFIVVEPLLAPEPKATPAPQLAAMVAQPPTPRPKNASPSEPAAETRRAVTTQNLSETETAKSGSLLQYTQWGMSPEELLAFGKGNIVKASPGEINPYNQGRSAGTTLAIDAAEVVLTSAFKSEGAFEGLQAPPADFRPAK